MESLGVLATSIDVRHEPTQLLSSMSTPQPHNSLKATSSRHSEFLRSPSELANVAGPSRNMVSSPLRTCTPITARVPPPPPIDTSVATPTKRSPIPLERVPTEPASAPPPRQQPSADELAVLGIKVRDFAFEPSDLPRVPTVQRPPFREFDRQFDETPEDAEKRRLNEARRLEFNTPRRKNETPEERGARLLAFDNPGVGGFPNDSTSVRFVPRLDESSIMKLLGLPNFGAASSHSTSNMGPSPNLIAGSNTGLPLRRQPSEVLAHQASSNSLMSTSAGVFRAPATQRPSPSASPSRVGETDAIQTREPSIESHSPRQEWLAQSSQDTRSQFFPSVVQTESRSQDFSTSSQSQLPGLSVSQADSEMDDEEYIKTPLVTPNGSLVFGDDHFDLNLVGSAADLERNRSNTSLSRYLASGVDAGVIQTDSTIVRSSTLPDSQVAELLQAPAGISGIEEDVSASQMGLESQDLLSQPAWQQQSQSPFQASSQEPESQESQIEDVEMPESQPVYLESKSGTADCISTVTPAASFTRTSSTLLSPIRAYESACSNNAPSSPRRRPIPRHSPDSSLSHHPSNARTLSPSPSHSVLRHSPSLGIGPSLSRQTSISSIHSKASSSASAANRGKGRYNLRTPSPKKARLLDSPSFTSAPPGRRTRSRTQSAPLSKRSVSGAASAASARRSKSSASMRKRAMKVGRGKKGNVDVDADVIMGEESNGGQEANGVAVE